MGNWNNINAKNNVFLYALVKRKTPRKGPKNQFITREPPLHKQLLKEKA